jgi:hypothetical protein
LPPRAGEGRGRARRASRGAGPRRRGQGKMRGCAQGEKRREREREREGRGGELTSGSNSGDHHLQNLGHHGEREVEEGEGGCCAGNPNERGRRGGGAWGVWGAGGARAELGQAGLLRGSKPTTRTTLKRAPIANRKPRRNETNTQHHTRKCASA